jgi:peptidase E
MRLMKLFLASSGDKTLHLLSGLTGTTPSETKVAFIANAADPYTGDERWGEKIWVKDDKKKFQELGYIVSDIDLENMDADSLEKSLAEFDVIHICGGDALYFIRLLQRRGLSDSFKKIIADKIYTGTSAGSMVAAPSLEIEKYSDEAKPDILAELENFNGLGLVNFLIIPHAANKDFKDDFIRYVSHLPEYNVPLIFLYDNQAVWVEDESIKIINA